MEKERNQTIKEAEVGTKTAEMGEAEAGTKTAESSCFIGPIRDECARAHGENI